MLAGLGSDIIHLSNAMSCKLTSSLCLTFLFQAMISDVCLDSCCVVLLADIFVLCLFVVLRSHFFFLFFWKSGGCKAQNASQAGMERLHFTDGVLCLRVSLQMQKGQLPERPPTDLPHLHLCQRGSVCDPALGPLSRQSHPGSLAQRNHPGGWQQRRRSVQMGNVLSQFPNEEIVFRLSFFFKQKLVLPE